MIPLAERYWLLPHLRDRDQPRDEIPADPVVIKDGEKPIRNAELKQAA